MQELNAIIGVSRLFTDRLLSTNDSSPLIVVCHSVPMYVASVCALCVHVCVCCVCAVCDVCGCV